MNESGTTSRKIIKNTLYNATGRFWGALVGLFLTPYIISRLGIERFGIWAVVGVITGYFGLLDFGIGSSFVRYIAEFHQKDDYAQLNRLLNTGFVFYSLFALAAVGLAVAFIHPLMHLFKVPPGLEGEASFVFILGIVLFTMSNALSCFAAVQTGLQRMDISNAVSIALSLPNIAGVIFFLQKGYGLRGLMVNNLIVFALNSAISLIVAFRLLPGLRLNPLRYFDRAMLFRLFNFGYRMQLARISGVVTMQTDKILLGCMLSLGTVALYQLGNSLVMYAVTLAVLLVSALMPAFIEIESQGGRKTLIEAYMMSFKYYVFFIVPLFFFLMLSAQQLVFIWVGMGYAGSVWIVRILAAGFILNTVAQVSSSVCIALDRPGLMAKASLIMIVTNIPLSFLLIRAFGFTGAAWGSVVATNAGTLYFLAVLHKYLNIRNRKLIELSAPFLLSALTACAVTYTAGGMLAFLGLPPTRVGVLCGLLIDFVIFLAVYLACVLYGKAFDGDERSFIRDRLPFVSRLPVLR